MAPFLLNRKCSHCGHLLTQERSKREDLSSSVNKVISQLKAELKAELKTELLAKMEKDIDELKKNPRVINNN